MGHTLIFGPTGAGKSTLLATIAAQFRRYQNSQVFVFDKGVSMFPLCLTAGGKHYDVGEGDLAFAPLGRISESEAELSSGPASGSSASWNFRALKCCPVI